MRSEVGRPHLGGTVLAVIGALALVLSACGGDGGTGDSSAGGSLSKDGFVTVGGETYEFSFDSPGRCGLDGNEGRVAAQAFEVAHPDRQLAFTYGLPEETTDGLAALQIVIYDGEGQQVWYSLVGFTGTDTGSVTSLTKSGNTVSVTGQLQRVSDGTLADFTAEATCNQ